jgi:hypothetical protein
MSESAHDRPSTRKTFVHVRLHEEPADAGVRARPDPPRRQSAVVVVHGMGQQVPFETIEQVGRVLRDAEHIARANEPPPEVTIDVVKLGDTRLMRAEVRVTDPDGAPRDVHIYEAYWAPVTEGKVTLRDVVGFLVSAAWNNLWYAFTRWRDPDARRRHDQFIFDRWMFEHWVSFKLSRRSTVLRFGAVLLLLAALFAINAVMLTVVAASSIPGHVSSSGTAWPTPEMLAQLTIDAAGIVPVALALWLGCVVIPRRTRQAKGRKQPAVAQAAARTWRAMAGAMIHHLRATIAWAFVWLGLATLIAMGVAMVFHVLGEPVPFLHKLARYLPFIRVLVAKLPGPWQQAGVWFVWGLLLLASAGLRWFIVEYVGDVAAYVSSHAVSRFFEIRRDIHQISMRVARAVYGARGAEDGDYLYDDVVMLGHSLGSVISYDTLNDLMLEDAEQGWPYLAARRTAMLLTFGSPLEKTAFVFRTQRPHAAEVREASAAAVQPMVLDYAFRPRCWVNVFSRNDWISGELRFYDDDRGAGGDRRVENIEDFDATQPLFAHNQYWENPLLAGVLRDALTGRWGKTPERSAAERPAG